MPRLPPGKTVDVAADDTAARFAELGIAAPAFAVLPRNFASVTSADEFVFEESTSALVTLGRRAGLTIAVPGPASYRTIHEKDAEFIAPVLQVGHAFLVEGGATIAVEFLKQLAQHARKHWGAAGRDRQVALEIAVTKGTASRMVRYNGPQDGLEQVIEIAKAVFDD